MNGTTTMLNQCHKIWSRFLAFTTAEWVLTSWDLPNGGSVILFRSVLISAAVYLSVMAISNGLDPGRSWAFSLHETRIQILNTLTRLGTIFAATYVAL